MFWKKKRILRKFHQLSKQPLTKEQKEFRDYAKKIPKSELDSLLVNCYSKASENLAKFAKK